MSGRVDEGRASGAATGGRGVSYVQQTHPKGFDDIGITCSERMCDHADGSNCSGNACTGKNH